MQFIFFIILLVSIHVPQDATKNKVYKNFKKTPYYYMLPRSTSYYITNEVNPSKLTYILTYMQIFLCFNFTKVFSPIINKPGINFFKSGINNKVVRPPKKNKPIRAFLKAETYDNDKKLSFFVGLAFSLIPETTRYDRDNNVKVYFKNISTPFKRYYKKKKYYQKTYHKTEFDFGSKMIPNSHYGSKKKKLTYEPISHLYDMKYLGIHRTFSFNDRKHLHDMFCSKQCKERNDCKNGVFLSRDCKKCICPVGFIGNKCEETHNDKFCGITTHWASSAKKPLLIETRRRRCSYLIKSNENEKVKLIIKQLKISDISVCESDYAIEIKYRKDKGATGILLCGDYTNIEIPPESNEVYILTSGPRFSIQMELEYQGIKKN